MANPAMRFLLAVVAGLMVAMLVIAGVEAMGHALFPPPTGLDLARTADQERLMDALPVQAKIAVVVAWLLGSLAGAVTAIAIARRVLPAWIVGLAIAGLGLWTTQMFPHPDWMLASAVVLPLVAVVIAKRLMAGRIAKVTAL